jgi:hypothetical protein
LERSAKRDASRLAVSFIRLLFNNSEEVKRIRFSQGRIRLGSDCIIECWGIVCFSTHQALSMTPATRRRGVKHIVYPNGAQGYRVK